MQEKPDVSLEPTPEQIRYAGILEKGMYVGLACLFVTFGLYVFGIMDPYVRLDELPEHWSKPVHVYLEQAGDERIEAGWSWTKMLGYGDFVNFIGIALLAGVTIGCYLSIVPVLLKNNDKVYAALALLEALVLIVAASGILGTGGGH